MKNKRLLVFIAILLVVLISAPMFLQQRPLAPVFVFASTGSTLFAQRYVMDDLRGSTLEDGSLFDERDFPYNPGLNTVRVLNFVEYAFSYHARHRGNFGLFVYLWNPSRLDIVTHSPGNTVQMAIEYENGRPVLYDKLPLRFLSRSTGTVEGLFYKFQIELEGQHRASLLARLNENIHERRYDISGIELTLRPQFLIRDFDIGRTYMFRGFAANHGELPNRESTLEMSVVGLRTLPLNVHPTWFRTRTSDRGRDFQHQINSVFFSVPNEILEEYGRLQRIMVEWWEYQTAPIVVTSRASLYNRFTPFLGQRVTRNRELRYGVFMNYWERVFPSIHAVWGADWIYNEISVHTLAPSNSFIEHYLFNLFLVDEIHRFDPNGADRPHGRVSSERLLDHIMTYDASFHRGTLPTASGRQISADLFTDTIDSHRLTAGFNRGHNRLEIDYGDTFDFLSYWQGNPGFWQQVRDFGFWRTITNRIPDEVTQDIGRENIHPIYLLQDSDFVGTDSSISNELLVRVEDIPTLRTFHNQAQARNETAFLFRFALTDYFSNWLTIIDRDNSSNWSDYNRRINRQAYKAQQTVFLDFDIIQLTFNGDFGYIVIPVVMDPIDIVPDIDPPFLEPPGGWRFRLPNWALWAIGLFFLALLAPLIVSVVMLFAILSSTVLNGVSFVAGSGHSNRKRHRRRY